VRYIPIYLRIDRAPQVITTQPMQGISLSLFSKHGYHTLEVLTREVIKILRPWMSTWSRSRDLRPAVYGRCHCLSMQLNCYIGYLNGIASIVVKLLITYTVCLCYWFLYVPSSPTPHTLLWVREGALYLLLSSVLPLFSLSLIDTTIVLDHRCFTLLLAIV